jgi:ectoine hydroxylase-related dioxygenase (phytanoyl-CoA dioxygenase family)
LPALEDALAGLPRDQAGVRIRECPVLRPLLVSEAPIGSIAASALGKNAHPVRAILFDKTQSNNWSLGWHQDRTISVKERHEVAGFGPWTRKAGMYHVAPPAARLSRMVTLRVHLDDVPAENGPLVISPGSHLYGRVAENEIDALIEKCGVITCLARAGDVWLYSTLIIHASAAASIPARRRVLQVDYAAEPLPGRLEWLGV